MLRPLGLFWASNVHPTGTRRGSVLALGFTFNKLRAHTLRMDATQRRQLKRWPGVVRGEAAAALALVLAIGTVRAADASFAGSQLRPATSAAFQRYVDLTDSRNQEELRAAKAFLWIDDLPEAQRIRDLDDLKRGEVKIARTETRDGREKISCPGGMIHHWRGLVFIPKASLQSVLDVLQDYDHHAEYYAPDVEKSKLESRDGDHFSVFLRFRRHKVITVVLDTTHEVRYFRDGAKRAHSRSSATRIAEVVNAGKKDEREKPPGDDGGFLWGMETWWRMEERDDGVYVQSEVVSLTRDIPAGLGWLIGPFVTSIPKETLSFTLEATRKAVQAKR
jgi:hypothetical protein